VEYIIIEFPDSHFRSPEGKAARPLGPERCLRGPVRTAAVDRLWAIIGALVVR
jgi:hypothetical protein